MVSSKSHRSISNWPTKIEKLYSSEKDYKRQQEHLTSELAELQQKLYAQAEWAVLLVFQGMDTAGKDSAISHVMSGVNPQGCRVKSFRKPNSEELSHDFLWRTVRHLPERGKIGIFNRSYYEEVLVPRVHQQVLVGQNIPQDLLSGKRLWRERMKDICHHESYLSRQGWRIVKFFLHISKDEQRERLLARIDDPNKNWKFDLTDVDEREHWDEYQQAFEECLQRTSTHLCPWYVIPADDKKNARLIISQIIVQAMKDLQLHWPEVNVEHRAQLKEVRKLLTAK